MWDRNADCTQQIAAVVEYFEGFGRGDTLTWAAIEQAMGCGRQTARGAYVLTKARRRLLREREIVSLSVINVGLKFLTHAEAADIVPGRRQKRASRQLHFGILELRSVDGSTLSDNRRRHHAAQLRGMEQKRKELRRSVREHSQARKTESLPRRGR